MPPARRGRGVSSSKSGTVLALACDCTSWILIFSDPLSLVRAARPYNFSQYCDNDAECSDVKHVPAARDMCVKKTSNVSGEYQRWENSEWQHCHFDERGWFSWVLVRLSKLFPPATEVG